MQPLAPESRLWRPTGVNAVIVALAAAIVAALIQILWIPVDADVSWLITVNEKLLAGRRLYVDVIEANPPASVWLYTPAVWLAQLAKIRPEAVVVAQFLLAGLASVLVSVRLASRLQDPPSRVLFAALASFAVLLLPMGDFAQREHAALLLAMPVLTALALVSERGLLTTSAQLLTGVAIGAIVVIKPHFAIPMAFAILFAWRRSRNIRPLLTIGVAAGAMLACYVVSILLFTRPYLALVPVLGEVYVAERASWTMLLIGPVTAVPVAIAILAFVVRPRRMDGLAALLLLGAAGFAAAALIQGRGYLNHALPATGLGLVGLVLLASRSEAAKDSRALVFAGTAGLAVLELYAGASIQPDRELERAVVRVAPPHPALIALGPNLLTGHPLVRNLDGRWVGSRPALFIAAGARDALARRGKSPLLQEWYRRDLRSFADDVTRGRPDVILVDARPSLSWMQHEPAIAAVLEGYRPAARAGDIILWVPRQPQG